MVFCHLRRGSVWRISVGPEQQRRLWLFRGSEQVRLPVLQVLWKSSILEGDRSPPWTASASSFSRATSKFDCTYSMFFGKFYQNVWHLQVVVEKAAALGRDRRPTWTASKNPSTLPFLSCKEAESSVLLKPVFESSDRSLFNVVSTLCSGCMEPGSSGSSRSVVANRLRQLPFGCGSQTPTHFVVAVSARHGLGKWWRFAVARRRSCLPSLHFMPSLLQVVREGWAASSCFLSLPKEVSVVQGGEPINLTMNHSQFTLHGLKSECSDNCEQTRTEEASWVQSNSLHDHFSVLLPRCHDAWPTVI